MGLDSYTKVCSTFDGVDGATAYADPVAGAYTFVGTAQLSTAQKKFGTASLLLDGNSDYVTLPDSADWNFGTGDFTIDCFVRFTDISVNRPIVSQLADASNKWYLTYNSINGLQFYHADGGTARALYYKAWTPTLDTWYHIAIVRNGTSFYMFINGISQSPTEGVAISTNDLGNIAATLNVGNYSTEFFFGWIDELRLSNGIARWTNNFVVPYKPYGSAGASQLGQMIGGTKAYLIG